MLCGKFKSSYVGNTNTRISVSKEEYQLRIPSNQRTLGLFQHNLESGNKIDFDTFDTSKALANIRVKPLKLKSIFESKR